MLSLTRKADYALVALVYLGVRQRQGLGPASARSIAEAFELPLPVLMNTLKALCRRGLVDSRRGVGGGYALARDPGAMTLLDVVRAVEGLDESEATDADDGERRPASGPHAERGAGGATESEGAEAVRRLQCRLDGFLDRLTLADLLTDSGDSEPGVFVALRTGAEEAEGVEDAGDAHNAEAPPRKNAGDVTVR